MPKFSTPGAANSVVATDLRIGGGERLVGQDGSINASSKKDLNEQLARLQQTIAGGTEVLTEEAAVTREETAKLHREAVQAAFVSMEEARELGNEISASLSESADRMGFMRRFLNKQELEQGGQPRARMRMKNVRVAIAVAANRTETQVVRDNEYNPPEFTLVGRPFIEKRELARTTEDMVEQKFNEGLEAFMVTEDRMWKKMADSVVGYANDFTTIQGDLTPGALANVRDQVDRWQIPAQWSLLSSDLWSDVIGNSEFTNAMDQVHKHELILSGYVGVLYGMNIITDSYRHPQHKVLDRGQFYVVGSPENHGQYTDRDGIESAPVDESTDNIPGRGWAMNEVISQIITNPRSVAAARRVK